MDSQFYNDYSLPSELCGYPTPAVVTGCGGQVMSGAMWGSSSSEENNLVPIFCENNGAASFDVVSPESDISSCTMGAAATFPELLGFSEDAVAPVSFSEYSHLGLNGISGLNHSFGGDSYLQLYNKMNKGNNQFGDQECCTGFMPANSKPLGLAVQEIWGFNQGNQVPAMEDQSNMKVGRYSEEERKERIERYLKKRNQRNFNKTIKYACRKTLADKRVRVRGRFARNSNEQLTNEDSTHQEMAPKKIDTDCSSNHACNDRSELMYCSGGAVQIKYDEEDWLQEAMASLVYLPYVTAG